MTILIADIARWQRDLPLEQVKKAGFQVVNIKTSHGPLSGSDIYPNQANDVARAQEARSLGLGICTFHWLDSSMSGSAQAMLAYSRIEAMGGPARIGHSVDCEDPALPAAWETWVEYVITMQRLMRRQIFAYTGDWWWAAEFTGRNGAAQTPYLWAAPSAGYQPLYPGASSAHWNVSYGGWKQLAVMQYEVGPPSGVGVTTKVKVSKSAIRDHQIWTQVSGVTL